MSRDVRYSIRAKADDDRRVRVIMIPANNAWLPTGFSTIELPWKAFEGTTLKISAGWKDKVLSLQDPWQLKLKADLSELVGSPEIEAAAGYLANPRFALGGNVSAGGYIRLYDVYNLFLVYDDEGTGDEPYQLLGAFVQTLGSGKKVSPQSGGPVELEIECVDLITWALRTVLPADIAAWVWANGAGTADGPYNRCWSTLYTDGPRRYGHAHGDHPENFVPGSSTWGGPRRQFTFYPLSYVYQAIGEVADHVMKELLRGLAPSGAVFVIVGTPVEHWSLFEPDWTAANTHDPAGATEPPSILGAVRMLDEDDNPGPPVHGFFFVAQENSPRDTIGSWPNAWQFLKETTEGLVAKISNEHGSASADNMPDIAICFSAIKAVPAFAAGDIDLEPDDLATAPTIVPGANAIDAVSGAVPAGGSRDQSKITLELLQTAGEGRTFSLPRTWHTLPIVWPEHQRRYQTFGSGGVRVDIFTPGVNCLTLWYRTNAGGILGTQEYVRYHHHVVVSDGAGGTQTDTGGAYALPAPNPIDHYQQNSQEGDTDFGTPLLEAYLKVQIAAGMPLVAAHMLLALFGNPTDYESDADGSVVGLPDLGNRCDSALFPNGNAFLDGKTYLGELKGAPIVASMEYDVLGGTTDKLRLEAL